MSNNKKLMFPKNPANHTPLTPVSLVRRTARAYPDNLAILDGTFHQSWAETYQRCLKIAGGLQIMGLEKGDVISVLARNIPAAVELNYAIPMTGFVLNMINTRLNAKEIAHILDHADTKAFFIDNGLANVAEDALRLSQKKPKILLVQNTQNPTDARDDWDDYSAFVERSDAIAEDNIHPATESEAMALNYTSGTTGNPKGVIYHHRGAYLNALGNALEWSLDFHPRYLWTLPLFHCNGWCFPWTIAAKAGVNICLSAPVPSEIIRIIEEDEVTHLCGAPIVLNMILTELEDQQKSLSNPIEMMVAGAPPPAAVLERAAQIGFDITHVYGLTEVYGPTAICAWRDEWNDLPKSEVAQKKGATRRKLYRARRVERSRPGDPS